MSWPAWSIANGLPQIQCRGVFFNGHPYLIFIASWNSPLFMLKPLSSSGRAVSHIDAPFSCARSIALFSGGGSDSLTS